MEGTPEVVGYLGGVGGGSCLKVDMKVKLNCRILNYDNFLNTPQVAIYHKNVR